MISLVVVSSLQFFDTAAGHPAHWAWASGMYKPVSHIPKGFLPEELLHYTTSV